MVLFARGHRTLQVLTPIIAATVVSALTFEAVKHGIADPGLRTLIAPLVTLLPGAALTTATVELASGEMVAGVWSFDGATNAPGRLRRLAAAGRADGYDGDIR